MRRTQGRSRTARAALLVALSGPGLLGTGCMRSYLVPYDALAAAEREVAAGADPDRIAVATVPSPSEPSEPATCLRLSHLPRHAARRSELVEVRAADSNAERIGGAIMTSLGFAHYLGLITHATIDFAIDRSCRAQPGCFNEDFTFFITAPILGIIGSSLVAPGVTLAARGYGRPSDAWPVGTVDRCLDGRPAPAP